MLDTFKIYNLLLNKSKLKDNVLHKFVERTNNYFFTIKSDLDKISPLESIDVLSLLIETQPFFINTNEWEKLVGLCLTSIRDSIYKNEITSISAFSGYSYICFIVRELVKRIPDLYNFQQNLELLLSNSIRSYLNLRYKSNFEFAGNFELINGLAGLLKCCCDVSALETCNQYIDEIIFILLERLKPKIVSGKPVPGFYYIPSKIEKHYMHVDAPNGCVNYSMSHGIAGTLCALSFAYLTHHNSEIKSTAEILIDALLNVRYYVNDIAYWPGRITIEQYWGTQRISHIANQMSWCYGSPGILRAIYIAANAFNMSNIKNMAVNEMKKISILDRSEYNLTSPIVCHGLSGMALIMRTMYEDTNELVFLSRLEQILDLLIFNFAYKEISNYNFSKINGIYKYDYLEGYSGILQTIYSILTGHINVNEKRLLIR